MKACNIAEYEGVFELYRLLIPDEVLHRNDPPRFMVMAFCPWNLAAYDDWATSTTYEAILLRLKFLPNFETAFLLAKHPSQTFDFLTRTLRMTVASPAHAELAPRRRATGKTTGFHAAAGGEDGRLLQLLGPTPRPGPAVDRGNETPICDEGDPRDH